jgi:hypothetical protein
LFHESDKLTSTFDVASLGVMAAEKYVVGVVAVIASGLAYVVLTTCRIEPLADAGGTAPTARHPEPSQSSRH